MRTGGGAPALVPSEVGQVGLGEWALRGEQDRPRWFSECFEEKEGVGGMDVPRDPGWLCRVERAHLPQYQFSTGGEEVKRGRERTHNRELHLWTRPGDG